MAWMIYLMIFLFGCLVGVVAGQLSVWHMMEKVWNEFVDGCKIK